MLVPAADSDIPAVAALMNRAYRGESSGWSSETSFISGDRTSEALLRADLAAEPAAVLLKWVDGPGAGFDGSVWLQPVAGNVWYLGSLAVDPHRQNDGLGRRILAAAEDWARARDATRIRMTVVNVRETLIAFYGRCGYAPTGATEPFPYGDDRFGKPLRDDLAFVILEKPV
ncbi:GNAT family N-acetyltransferase [Polymorphobacter arshaanensis]|uniref:GNAT family N-acetyltransferase n=1 Tax=Glacieibacterium arshaanense TaxID=2511025 RepID=A0A4Y9EL12_9SPHN|nr:GNAT family N-acetyltransferase [Polymorphobacter arshaanensis]TFU00379.1 GNAT family N-acetyltransferase [Polymorphobacter arshaanensis]